MEKEWTSIPISSWDRVSTKENKISVDISSWDTLIETLIREARSIDTDHLGLSEIPLDFLSLIDTDIIVQDLSCCKPSESIVSLSKKKKDMVGNFHYIYIFF